jgi:membrane associated rhomboid family serine protease
MKFEKENWESTRKKGFLNFLLVRGILFFGLTFTVVQMVIKLISGDTINFIASIISGLIGGLIYGTSMWYFAEKRFKKENTTNEP